MCSFSVLLDSTFLHPSALAMLTRADRNGNPTIALWPHLLYPCSRSFPFHPCCNAPVQSQLGGWSPGELQPCDDASMANGLVTAFMKLLNTPPLFPCNRSDYVCRSITQQRVRARLEAGKSNPLPSQPTWSPRHKRGNEKLPM